MAGFGVATIILGALTVIRSKDTVQFFAILFGIWLFIAVLMGIRLVVYGILQLVVALQLRKLAHLG